MPDDRIDHISLGDPLRLRLEREGISASTRSRERWQSGLVLAFFDGDRPACSLKWGELVEWADFVRASTSPLVAERIIRFFRSCLRFAAEEGLISRNPARDLRAGSGGRVVHGHRRAAAVPVGGA